MHVHFLVVQELWFEREIEKAHSKRILLQQTVCCTLKMQNYYKEVLLTNCFYYRSTLYNLFRSEMTLLRFRMMSQFLPWTLKTPTSFTTWWKRAAAGGWLTTISGGPSSPAPWGPGLLGPRGSAFAWQRCISSSSSTQCSTGRRQRGRRRSLSSRQDS